MQADARQLLFLKSLLNSFADSTGLKVNYRKSQILPINVDTERMNHLANTFGCAIGSFLVTYLGLPMGTTKRKMEDLTPMMDRVERRLSGCATWLSYTERLEMVNTAITPIVIYALGTIKLPKGVIDNIDRIRKQCLWRGNTEKKRGSNLIAWETVQKPKEKGGLGVIILKLQNYALLLKHLHKFYNQADIPLVQLVRHKYYQNRVPHATRELGSFWWKDVMRLNNIYRTISRCFIGNGATACFWEDQWADGILATLFPRIASFAKSSSTLVQEIMHLSDLDSIFFLPLPSQATEKLQQLQMHIQNIPYDEDTLDHWQPTWGSEYTSRKFYKHACGNLECHPICKSIWKSKCTTRVKFFAWLLLVDRLNTKTMLTRKHIFVHNDDLCVMCSIGAVETIDHLFFTCPFARQCWAKINIS